MSAPPYTLHHGDAPRPYWQSADGRAVLYLGDCLEIAPTLAGVDALISDPPYGMGYVHSGTGRAVYEGAPLRRHDEPIHGDDVPFNPAPWLGYRHVALWGVHHYAARMPAGGWHVWDKTRGGYGPDDKFGDADFLWSSAPEAPQVLHYLWKGVCQDGEKGEVRHHPTQKPIRAMTWAMERARVPADALVLDPYMGSGTTGLACIATGRRFVGIEIKERFAETAARRMEAAELPLFADPAPAAMSTPSLFAP